MSMTENKTIKSYEDLEDNKKYFNKAVDEMVEGIREILECNAIYNIDPITTLANQVKEDFELKHQYRPFSKENFILDEVTAQIYANANNEDNYINDTFIQYLEDDVLLIIDREDENYFVNLIYNDIECEPSCINNFSPDNRLKANEMISAIRNRIYDYWDLRGNDFQPDFYKTDAFRVETEVNGLNTPSVDFDEKDDR